MCHSSSLLPAAESADLDTWEIPNTGTHLEQRTQNADQKRGANTGGTLVTFCWLLNWQCRGYQMFVLPSDAERHFGSAETCISRNKWNLRSYATHEIYQSLRTHILQDLWYINEHVFNIRNYKHAKNKTHYPAKRIPLISSKYHQNSSHDSVLKAQFYIRFSCVKISYETKIYMGKTTLRNRYTKTTHLLGTHLHSTKCYSK
jgi:hypothetical protein